MAVLTIIIASWLLCLVFRFTIFVTLSARTDNAPAVAHKHGLAYRRVQVKHQDSCAGLLAKDYAILKRLLESGEGGVRFEDRLVMLYYVITAVWYRTAALYSYPHARVALAEVLRALDYLANAVGERCHRGFAPPA